MICLGIDCSAKAASAALVTGGRLLAQYYQDNGLTHSRTLLPMLGDMLKNCGLTLDDLGLIGVSAGPGSFTGLRIGVATVKGLCWGKSIPCAGVSTLEAMAQNLRHEKGLVCCVMDARRGQVYNALFSSDGRVLTRLCGDRAISPEELDEDLKKYGLPVFLIGDGTGVCLRALTYGDLRPPPPLLYMQNAWGVAAAALENYATGVSCDAATLTPKYLRLSQAERERLEKLNTSINIQRG